MPMTYSPTKADTLQHSLEQAAGGIGFHLNAHKTEYMCFNLRGDIYILRGGPLKLVDRFTYLESNVSSTEKYISTWQARAWTAINRLLVIWKSDLTDKIKQFFPISSCVDTTIWMPYRDTNQTYGEKAWWQLYKNAASCIEQVLEATPYKAAAVWPLTTHHENYPR